MNTREVTNQYRLNKWTEIVRECRSSGQTVAAWCVSKAEKIYIACGYTDMRKSIDGLAAIVQQNFQLNPFQNSLFLFCGRQRNRMKALYWEGDGFVLLYKRLEDGRYQWPMNAEAVRSITSQEFRWLLEDLSIDQPKAVRNLNMTACL